MNKRKRKILTKRELSDLEMLVIGAFYPLVGYLCKRDYDSVIKEMRLSDGSPWSIPITLSVSKEEAKNFKEGEEVELLGPDLTRYAILELEEKFLYDKVLEAKLIYRTTDEKHPGVKALYNQGEVLLGGKVRSIRRPYGDKLIKYRIDPVDSKKLFKEKGWRTIVGFQTRNPVHRAHEYIQKCALEIVDGLFFHPLVGETKPGDIPADIRMKCYQILIERYYPKDRVVLAVNPATMRYAGPREAIFHALVRRNYGCTHFIVGRDHAGVGNYYGPYDAHHIFSEFKEGELGIVPLFFDNAFFCFRCGNYATQKTCPHSKEDHLELSGTEVRALLKKGESLPSEFTRAEIAQILIEEYQRL
jgi:sulfate adenylyltransferase